VVNPENKEGDIHDDVQIEPDLQDLELEDADDLKDNAPEDGDPVGSTDDGKMSTSKLEVLLSDEQVTLARILGMRLTKSILYGSIRNRLDARYDLYPLNPDDPDKNAGEHKPALSSVVL
jgi:hypothetical protein